MRHLSLCGLLLIVSPAEPACANPSHKSVVHVLADEWMRDPHIHLRSDGTYYLTATRHDHVLFDDQGIEMWKSKNLVDWESIGVPWSFEKSRWLGALERTPEDKEAKFWLQSPEVYFIDDHWVAVHGTSRRRSNLLVTVGGEYNDSWREPMGKHLGNRADPSIFSDKKDGSHWLVWGCTKIQKLKADYTGFQGKEIAIGPSDRKLGKDGCTIRKIGKKYVLFGSAWSMDGPRQGTDNLYYCTADKLTGPYGPRKFAGRFCGHGTPFRDKQGRWWTTASTNGTYEQGSRQGTKNLPGQAALVPQPSRAHPCASGSENPERRRRICARQAQILRRSRT